MENTDTNKLNTNGADGRAVLVNLTEKADCPICSSREYKVIFKNNYPQELTEKKLLEVYRSSSDNLLMDQMVSCQNCGLVYLSPRIRSDITLESYKTVVDEVFFKQISFRVKTFTRSLNAFIKKFKITPDRSQRVLDVGCAAGAFLKAAHNIGFDVVGVEPSQWLCEEGKKLYGLDLRAGILQDFKFSENSFYVIAMWDVIEHLTDPCEVLLEIHKILDDKGYLIINYPDYASTVCRLMGKKWLFFLNVHLFYFTPKTIRKLLEKCGFEVIEIKPFWQTLGLGYIFKRAAAYFGFFKFFEKLTKMLNLYDFPVTYNMGQTTVVARKINEYS